MPDDAGPSGDNSVDSGAADQTGGKSYSQAELENILKQRLASEQKKHADYDQVKAELEKLRDSQKSEAERLAERSAAAEQAAAEAELRALRAEVALAKGLPSALAKRLSGSTPDELEADADELLTLVPDSPRVPERTPRPDLKSGRNPEPSSVEDPILRDLNNMLGIKT